jgi:hypothetical protein
MGFVARMEKEHSLRRMQTRNQPTPGEEAFSRVVESKEEIATLRRLLKEITEGPAFKGSQRSGQFLEFVVEQSIAGNFDQLKERLIGVQLFKREPTYDTGEDAIVRVTASDVRKRLLQHYGWFGVDCEFRIDLPLGSYIPRVSRKSTAEDVPAAVLGPPRKSDVPPATMVVTEPKAATLSLEPAISSLPAGAVKTKARSAWQLWRSAAILILAVALGWWLRSMSVPMPSSRAAPVLPWSALFSSAASPHLITSDPNIDTVQGITGKALSLSDYANHKYLPEPNTLTPEQIRFCKILLGVDSSAATPDPPITAKIAAIAQTFSKKLMVQPSRRFQLSFLSDHDNFIFLGSPRSNPWFSLFEGALNFQFIYDLKMGSEFIRNLHPLRSEQAIYVPSANGGGTGYSFAIVALVQNPDQNGEVLLLAGADGEATAAAGDFVTDLPKMSRALSNCGVSPSGPVRHFEILLRTDTMAGVPRRTEVIVCHPLSNTPLPAASNPENSRVTHSE